MAVLSWEYGYFLETLGDVNRFIEERNARQDGKQLPPEQDENGQYIDSEYQAMVNLGDKEMQEELEGEF